jgi:hypothetical protein
MTRILLHPHLLPRFGPSGGSRAELRPPWNWWRTKVMRSEDGTLVQQCYDSQTDVREASLLFNAGDDADIIDPPAMHFIEREPEYVDIGYGGCIDRTLMARGPSAECEVVWHRQPGPRWYRLPGNTCRPGDYYIGMVDPDREDRGAGDDSTRMTYSSDLRPLAWHPLEGAAELEGVRIAAAFGIPPAMVGIVEEPYRPPNDSRAAESLRELDEQVGAIFEASRNFEAANQQRPQAVLMSRTDYEELRRSVLRDEALSELTRYGRAGDRPFESILGLQIVADNAVPPGRIILVGPQAFGDPRREAGPLQRAMQVYQQAIDALTGLGAIAAEVGERSVGLFQQVPNSGYTISDAGQLRSGVYTPNQIRELEGLGGYSRRDVTWSSAPRPADILPEQDVVDEIDRLVNEQIRPGPRDDYSVNRYPKCGHCGHDWHGVLCEHCDCLGELEDPV